LILIFTESLSTTGLGHLGRCTALAEILIESGNKVEIILHSDGTGLGGDTKIPIEVLNWKSENELNEICNRKKPNLIIVDSYLADTKNYTEISSKVSKLICVDDMQRIEYPKDAIILNPGFGGRFIDYDNSRHKIFTGPGYALLRKPFREPIEYQPIRTNIERVLITVGGDDKKNIVPQLLTIVNTEFSNWKKEVIVGPSFKNLDKIIQNSDSNTFLHKGLSSLEIRDLMLDVDIAITAGGQTTYELAKCGIPMILMEIVENQRKNIQGFMSENLALFINLHNMNQFPLLIKENLNCLSLRENRFDYRNRLVNFFSQFNSVSLYDSII
jgi:UDP-2,4-diacetamido-2,4,6-trideoxy-beta-L-altropyranose hydrolase